MARIFSDDDVSLVVISRLDKAREWGVASPHAPIPGFWRTVRKYVTSTEYKVMAALGEDLNIPFAAFPFIFGYRGYGGYVFWDQAANWLHTYEKDPASMPAPPQVLPCK